MKKRTLTLIEIMIVILLITIIGGAVGYNMKGSLDKGKKFRTEHGKEQLRDMLLICLDEGKEGDTLAKNPVYYLRELGLVKDPEEATKDGWGRKYVITYSKEQNDFVISCENEKK
ncbi:MAG: type II secretion system GspH family protein [Verrucomicrobia bacterium]|nr:type II secretion system GspH family protein [Verrucomicrobiota bacterium]MDE3047065.1 type II secretion system protein [Verrucomicrobiota bacterium]